MKKHQRLVLLALGSIVLMGAGCAMRPIAEVYRQQAAAENVTFPMVLENPDVYKGYVVLWGGIIISTKNLKKGTDITVLETPLHGNERPTSRSHSQGRFIARSAKLRDPEIYRPGKKITVAGVVSGKEAHPLGETTYTYPVLEVKQIVLWQSRHYRHGYPYYWWGPGWDYWWGPDWDYGWGPDWDYWWTPGWGPYWWPYGQPYWGWEPGPGYYGDGDEGSDGGAHAHSDGKQSGEHGKGDGDQH
jgi:outer membrane lipoprotein